MTKLWLVSVNMGYGHQRTAYPFKDFAYKRKVMNVNDYEGMPLKDRKIWEGSKRFYDFVSRFKRVPVLGSIAFSLFDEFQKILEFYPKRDLSRPNFMIKRMYRLFEKGWGKDFIEKLGKEPLPLLNTFFTSAFMAEFFDYPGEIFCTVCDADISRSWAPLNPKKSRIKYFAPNSRTVERLKMYGIREENIFLTGYPLPLENIGSKEMEVLKEDLGRRLLNLDPEKEYYGKYSLLVDKHVKPLPEEKTHNLTIAFCIGGAGAQCDIALEMIKSFSKEIRSKEINIIIMAGIRRTVRDFFVREIKKLKLSSVKIVYSEKIEDYFKKFNKEIKETDILWTKPSELSFYTALGIPIIIAPPIGSQEDFNKKWLLQTGAGIPQEKPSYAREWIFDWLKKGRFADSAMRGFISSKKLGTHDIKEICLG